MPESPYEGKSTNEWLNITIQLIKNHPLSSKELVKETLEAWENIFNSGIGAENFKIGENIFPTPQIMGFLLHELIPLKIITRFPEEWKKDKEVSEKDLVYIPDLKYSFEIKTSSSKNKIFGNRSYGQPSPNPKKDKSGYYLAINFEKFSESNRPRIRLIRFGWLDHSDWISQKAATGQQARLTVEADKNKLIEIYPNSKLNSTSLAEF